jgi:hypothetical protein
MDRMGVHVTNNLVTQVPLVDETGRTVGRIKYTTSATYFIALYDADKNITQRMTRPRALGHASVTLLNRLAHDNHNGNELPW